MHAHLPGRQLRHREGAARRLREVSGVDAGLLDPVLLDFSDRRAAQKARYGGGLFPAQAAAEPAGTVFLDYFQRDRHTGESKGILALDLEGSR